MGRLVRSLPAARISRVRPLGLVRSRRGAISPEKLQHDFYTATAGQYDAQFVHADDEHGVALDFMSTLIVGARYSSVLDVGAGTGRGVQHFLDRHPEIAVRGVEPVRAMIERAEQKGVPRDCIIEAGGDALPFEDESFDVVCELGVLHHVAEPSAIVSEMIRVARRAVFLSDENRFAKGSTAHRVAKYGLYRLGLWPTVFRLAHRGNPYFLTESDGGVAYSYSVYDSLEQLNKWGDRAFLMPTLPAPTTWFHPLFGATNLLLGALREP